MFLTFLNTLYLHIIDNSFWVSLDILSGILLGFVDLLLFREEMIASVSTLDLVIKEKESWKSHGFFKEENL